MHGSLPEIWSTRDKTKEEERVEDVFYLR